MTDWIGIASDQLTARINPLGAELSSLADAAGRELMTDADPAYWSGHAPLLFPIVGRLNGDVLRLDGREYPMKQHGFARRMPWDVVGASSDAVTFRLISGAETRAAYPFDFELAVRYAVEGGTLSVVVRAANTGETPLPMNWLSPGVRLAASLWPAARGASRRVRRR